MKIFDSHAHYDDAAFDGDREELLGNLPRKGVYRVINVGASLEGCFRSVSLAAEHTYVYAAVGIHPEYAAQAGEKELEEVQKLLSAHKVVAVGEIGLDYHYEDGAPREKQLALFERQLMMANKAGLPVIVHDRDAHEDTLKLLKKHRPKGVLHCFSGSVEMMREVVALGMYIGLGGAVTFKNAKKPKAVAVAVPGDRLLTETDAPYMAPVPYRGERCDSSMIAETAAVIAALRGMEREELLLRCAENAERLFKTE